MCDTVIVTAQAAADGVAIFGKNSDREPNEAQYVASYPAADYPAGSRLRCTYIEIPQVEHTFAVLLSKPFWMWGAEMGANEHGVVIGNEAVFSRLPANQQNALLGMDLLRLGLERGKTAYDAMQVITGLLEEFGQGGSGGYTHSLFYHNSYLIADAKDAWVLETVGKHWAARQVRGVYTISNCLTIGKEWDLSSPDLVNFAVEKGWCRRREDFDYAVCYSDLIYTRFGAGPYRCQRSASLLASHKGEITPSMVMALLRDHGLPAGAPFRPDRGLTGANVCMHASLGPVRISQSTGSMVSYLQPENPPHFFTGTAAPCTSLFKPFWMDAGLPDMGPEPAGTYDPATLFWRHESLHRATLQEYDRLIQLYASERDALEDKFVAQALQMANQPAAERSQFSSQCVQEAEAAEARWLAKVQGARLQRRPGWLHSIAWQGFNRQAQMPDQRS
ncbi:MAG: C69 family dipeptidase [Anaerolineales bacterium]|nr:C69 family dipeptidase [Anaerolineales bacterium]